MEEKCNAYRRNRCSLGHLSVFSWMYFQPLQKEKDGSARMSYLHLLLVVNSTLLLKIVLAAQIPAHFQSPAHVIWTCYICEMGSALMSLLVLSMVNGLQALFSSIFCVSIMWLLRTFTIIY